MNQKMTYSDEQHQMIAQSAATCDGSGDRPDMQLARDKSESQKRENYYAEFHRSLPTQEPAEDSWLDAKKLEELIQERVMRDRASLHICDEIERLPDGDAIDEIAEEVALSLGLLLHWEYAGGSRAPGARLVDVLFWWE